MGMSFMKMINVMIMMVIFMVITNDTDNYDGGDELSESGI